MAEIRFYQDWTKAGLRKLKNWFEIYQRRQMMVLKSHGTMDICTKLTNITISRALLL